MLKLKKNNSGAKRLSINETHCISKCTIVLCALFCTKFMKLYIIRLSLSIRPSACSDRIYLKLSTAVLHYRLSSGCRFSSYRSQKTRLDIGVGVQLFAVVTACSAWQTRNRRFAAYVSINYAQEVPVPCFHSCILGVTFPSACCGFLQLP